MRILFSLGILLFFGCGVKKPPGFPEEEAVPIYVHDCSPYDEDCEQTNKNYQPQGGLPSTGNKH